MSLRLTIWRFVLGFVHICSIAVGALAAVFGSQADVNVNESRFALLFGVCLAVMGLTGLYLTISRRFGLLASTLMVVVEAAFLALLVNFGP